MFHNRPSLYCVYVAGPSTAGECRPASLVGGYDRDDKNVWSGAHGIRPHIILTCLSTRKHWYRLLSIIIQIIRWGNVCFIEWFVIADERLYCFVFQHAEFSFLLKERVCPLIIKLFSPSLKYRSGMPAPPSPTPIDKPYFPIVMRLLRIVSVLLKHYYKLLVSLFTILLAILQSTLL